jgi:lipoate-protein ligase B
VPLGFLKHTTPKERTTRNAKRATRNPKGATRNTKMASNANSRIEWFYLDLGLMDYQEAWELQLKLVNARRDSTLDSELVLFLEHPPVFTLGRRGGLDNLNVPKSFLDSQGISIIHVERGGDITYHGPGQLIVYPIVDLRAARWKVVDFVGALEEVMIRTAADWGIKAERNPLNRGAWVGLSKIGSIGIAVRRSVTFHGLALNVNTALEPFSWVNPCGLEGISVVSMKEMVGEEIPMDDVRLAARKHMESVFRVTLLPATLQKVQNLPEGSRKAL